MSTLENYKATISIPAFSGKMNLIFNEWLDRVQNSNFTISENLGCKCCYQEFEVSGSSDQLSSLSSEFYVLSTLKSILQSSDIEKTHPANPIELSKKFSKFFSYNAREFDYTIQSLDYIDGLLEHLKKHVSNGRILEPYLTAYIGETLLSNYHGSRQGNLYFHGIPNYYTYSIRIGDVDYSPSRFYHRYMTINNKNEVPIFHEEIHAELNYVHHTGAGLLCNIKDNKKVANKT
jgi:hypothetical protein